MAAAGVWTAMIAAVSSNCFMSGKSGSEAGGGGGDDDSCCVRRASTWGKGGQRKGGTEERGQAGKVKRGRVEERTRSTYTEPASVRASKSSSWSCCPELMVAVD